MNRGSVGVIHFVELVNEADSAISQNQRARFQSPFLGGTECYFKKMEKYCFHVPEKTGNDQWQFLFHPILCLSMDS